MAKSTIGGLSTGVSVVQHQRTVNAVDFMLTVEKTHIRANFKWSAAAAHDSWVWLHRDFQAPQNFPPVEEWIKLYWRKKGIVCVCMQEIAQLLLLWTFCSKKYTAVYNDVWQCMMTCADEPNDLIPRLHNQLVQGVACWSFVLCGQAAAHYESSLALKRARQTLARSWESWCWWCCKILQLRQVATSCDTWMNSVQLG
jgi:hypothetical protein